MSVTQLRPTAPTPPVADDLHSSLHDVVRRVLEASGEVDPGRAVELVIAELDEADRESALRQTLRGFVRQVMSQQRTGSARTPAAGRSSFVTEIRDGWQKRLRAAVHVGASQYKALADCTYDDLVAAAEERRELARRTEARGREYQTFASAVLDAAVPTFNDLPVETKARLLGGAS